VKTSPLRCTKSTKLIEFRFKLLHRRLATNNFLFKIKLKENENCSKSTNLIEFRFKLLHRRLATNNFLFKIKQKENENCTFCQNAPATLIHLFWTCQKTSKLWKSVMAWLQNMNVIQNNFTLLNTTALGLKPDTWKYALQINYCLLLAR